MSNMTEDEFYGKSISLDDPNFNNKFSERLQKPTSPNTSKREKVGNIHGVDIISDPSYKSDEIGIAYPPNTSSEVEKRAFQQLSGVLERMYYDVKKGVSDLRPYERQIKAIFRKRQDYETHQSEIKGRIDELDITMDKWNDMSVTELVHYAAERTKELNQMKGKDK